MSFAATRRLALAGGTGVASAVAYGGYKALKGDDIHKTTSFTVWQVVSAKKEKFILRTDSDTHDTEWDEIVKSLSGNSEAQSMLRNVNITKEELKSWCSNTRVESSEDQELLNGYESWCTKNSVFGQLKELKKEALKEGDPQWDTNVSSYPQSGNENKKLTDDSGNVKSDHTLKDKKELIDWCNRNLTTLYKQGSATTEAYIQWCTKDIATATATPTSASET